MATRTKAKRKERDKKRVSKNDVKVSSPKNRAVRCIVLAAFSVLMFCIVLISGDRAWNSVHNFINGVFGFFALCVPILFSYITVSELNGFALYKIKTKLCLAMLLVLLLCSSVFIFSQASSYDSVDYPKALSMLYEDGQKHSGGGFTGGIIGIPLVNFIGIGGSKIIIILATIVVFAILSLDGILYLRQRFLAKKKDRHENRLREKAKRTKASEDNETRKAKERVEKYRKKKGNRENTNIDVDLGSDMPLHPVTSVSENTEPPELTKLKRSLNKLNKADKEKAAEPTDSDDVKAVKDVAKAFIDRNTVTQKNNDEQNTLPLNRDTATKKKVVARVVQNESKPSYVFPPTNLLEDTKGVSSEAIQEELEVNGLMLVDTLKSFGVHTKIVDISRGPAVTRFELQPAAGVKISRITSLSDDIALNLAASGVRIEAPIPGKAAVGVEIPNRNVMIVRMKELVLSKEFNSAESKLTAVLGRDIAGNITVTDLSKMPHLLIAGSTGSGKSVCLNSLIISLLYKAAPDEVKFLMIDPKVVELGIYNGIPHLLVPVVTDAGKAAGALSWAVTEMLKRYKIFANCGVRDLSSYNHFVEKVKTGKTEYIPPNDEGSTNLEFMPQIVIIIDELSDLMMAAPREVEDSICRLAQMARAAGMHLIIATQRPSVNVITGIIKANIPSRIAFAVSSQIDSRTILDMGGAETLLGRGDMLFSPIGVNKPHRIQGCFVTDEEIERVTDFIKNSKDMVEYDKEIISEIERKAVKDKDKPSSDEDADDTLDILFDEAAECVISAGQASTSMLQRKLRVGYARAGRLIDELEKNGIVGVHEGSKPRQVLLTREQWLERKILNGGSADFSKEE